MKINRLYIIVIFSFWAFLFYYIFISSIPVPSNIKFENKSRIFSLLPQGWGFFTRDPRENITTLYEIDKLGNGYIKFTKTNNASNNYFGISRKNRLINLELGVVTSRLNQGNWIEKKGVFDLDFQIQIDTIYTGFYPKNIKGDFFIVEQERIPWAWSKNKDLVMPFKYKRIYVK
ncbi:MAG: SdpA family antimicrobial peptide system protein [Flavobacteriaceae bacterium]